MLVRERRHRLFQPTKPVETGYVGKRTQILLELLRGHFCGELARARAVLGHVAHFDFVALDADQILKRESFSSSSAFILQAMLAKPVFEMQQNADSRWRLTSPPPAQYQCHQQR